MAKDFYESLGVSKTATPDEIKSAYRKLAKQYHPDLNKDNQESATAKFKEINEAYEVLSDEGKRKNYDTFGSANPNMGGFGGGGASSQGGGFSNFGGFDDLFNMFTGFNGRGSSRTTPDGVDGSDITANLNINFKESAFGCLREIKLTRDEICKECKGTGAKNGTAYTNCHECGGSGKVRYTQNTLFGKIATVGVCKACNGMGKIIKERCPYCNNGMVKATRVINITIPAGIADGQVLTVKGEGNAGFKGGYNGDLMLIIRVENHALLIRDGDDLKVEIPIPFTTSILGGKVFIPSLEGKIELTIPELTQTGTIFKLKGKGVTHLKKSSRGDLIVTIKVELPKNLDRKTKEAIQEVDENNTAQYEKYKRYMDKLNDL